MSPSFTTLPLEIRHKIYGDVFNYQHISPTGSLSFGGTKYAVRHFQLPCKATYSEGNPNKVLALLLVNRQISDEAALYFYGNTKFNAELQNMIWFLEGVGTRRRNIIRRVEIVYLECLGRSRCGQKIFDLLSTMHSLQIIHFEVFELLGPPLQQQLLIGSGVFKPTGRADISVHHEYHKSIMVQESPQAEPIDALITYHHVWSCAKDTTEWKGMELVEISDDKGPITPGPLWDCVLTAFMNQKTGNTSWLRPGGQIPTDIVGLGKRLGRAVLVKCIGPRRTT